jgi:hypothetical protein
MVPQDDHFAQKNALKLFVYGELISHQIFV